MVTASSASHLPAKYPVGVNPAACPNYPYCNQLVDPISGYAVAPYNKLTYAVRPLAPIVYSAYPYAYATAGGDKYPANVNPAECVNYPYCHDGIYGNHAVGTFKSGYTGVVPYGNHAVGTFKSGYTGVVPVVHAIAKNYGGYATKYPAGALIALIFAAVLMVTASSASHLPAKYPVGVNPAACPNYPYCNQLVDPTSGYAVAPYNKLTYAVRPLAPIVYSAYPYAYATPGGDKYPANVNPAECVNYPYCHDGIYGNHAVGTFKSGYV
ncbi:unnamed protein product [Notodromas monacha]|uniref:Cuticle protein CPCFC domain-containing protein n=1 Tax=Notodromas monacha TaxID=399045 RepID=A0A7R9C0A4_9CRUS|nr:unnamed protein product [Notodromas monacha]CAG0923398.1 unnamed protein product [Notodromas monacha]